MIHKIAGGCELGTHRAAIFRKAKTFLMNLQHDTESGYHTIIRAAFVCVFVCLFVPYVLRGPLTDLRQTWWVYVGWPPICPWGVLFQKGQWVDGSTDHFRFPLYYICLRPHAATVPFAWQAAESNSAPFAVLHVNDVCRWTWQLLFRGSFSKRSTGRRVNGSTGQRVKRVNGSLSLSLYYIW